MAGDSQHLYQEMPALKGIGRKPKSSTVKNKLIVEGPKLRKVSVKMKMLDELSKDRSKLCNKQINCMRGLQALAGSLKSEVLDAVASVEMHSRKYRVAVKRRDLAVRLALAFVSRSERLKLKNSKRSKAWERKLNELVRMNDIKGGEQSFCNSYSVLLKREMVLQAFLSN